MRKTLLPASLLSSALTLSGTVYAGTASTTLDVTAVVGTACSVTTTPVDFGFVDPVGDVPATGSITTACTPNTTITIALDGGLYTDGAQRAMSDGQGNYMLYDLYEPDLGGIWGDLGFTIDGATLTIVSNGVDGTDVTPVGAYLLIQPIIVPDGFYSDVVNVTVTY